MPLSLLGRCTVIRTCSLTCKLSESLDTPDPVVASVVAAVIAPDPVAVTLDPVEATLDPVAATLDPVAATPDPVAATLDPVAAEPAPTRAPGPICTLLLFLSSDFPPAGFLRGGRELLSLPVSTLPLPDSSPLLSESQLEPTAVRADLLPLEEGGGGGLLCFFLSFLAFSRATGAGWAGFMADDLLGGCWGGGGVAGVAGVEGGFLAVGGESEGKEEVGIWVGESGGLGGGGADCTPAGC